MRGIALAATFETRLSAAGTPVPLPLVDVLDEPYLTTLARRLAPLPDMRELVVVTNEAIRPALDGWAAKLPDLGLPVRVLGDRTSRPEDRLGAVGDILFVLTEVGLDDDVLIVGGHNWFTYDLADFVRSARGRSPALVVTPVPPGSRPSRFGWVEADAADRVMSLQEHPATDPSGHALKAGCVYYLSRSDLHWLRDFAAAHSTVCSPGTFFAWLAGWTAVHAVRLAGNWHDRRGDHAARGPDLMQFRDIVRDAVNPRYATWEREAAERLQWATSHADLVDALDDADPNRRIVAARLLGHAGHLLSADGLAAVTGALLRRLDDPATNQAEYGAWQDDEESVARVCDAAADSLVRLGYAADRAGVLARARESASQA